MNKSFWLFTVVCALFVSAVTTVLSLSGALALPILVFPVLSLVIPLMVRRLKNAKFNDDLPLSMAIMHIVGLGGQYFHFFIRHLALQQRMEL